MATAAQRMMDATERQKENAPRCHKCAKQTPEVDLVECSSIHCDRHVCSECASEVEFELEACAEHAHGVYCDMRDMYRNALRRATEPEYRKDAGREVRHTERRAA